MRNRLSSVTLTPRQFQLAALFALGAVRLTGSGLGCPDWPRCYGHVYPPLQTHSLIEFSNRVVGALVGVVTVVVVVGAWRRRPFRRDLALLALTLPLGVAAQAVLGGYTVEEKLAPGFVMAHFALSMAILVAAVALAWRAREGPARPPYNPDRRAVWAVRALAPFAAVVLVAGTTATAAGPHSGGAVGQTIKRLRFDGADTLNLAIHIHGSLAFAFGLAAVAVWAVLEPRVGRERAVIMVNGEERDVAQPGALLLFEHGHHAHGELALELGSDVRCDAVCFTPGLAL